MSFKGKVILITGASSGIGADCARHLARLGGKVAIIGRNVERLNDVAEEIKNNGSPTPLSIVGDVTQDAQRIIDDTIKHFGQLDVLVNNAGILIQDNVAESFNIEEFDRIWNTNLRSVAILTHLAVPYLEKTKGNIVNISSIAGLMSFANTLAYCVSKSALDQFTKCCAIDLAPKKIRVNAINPAMIRTPIFGALGLDSAGTEQLFKDSVEQYLVGRIGEVSDTSAAIEYLASDSASFLTGLLLPVDGGVTTSGIQWDSKKLNMNKN